MIQLKVAQTSTSDQVFTNCVYVSQQDYTSLLQQVSPADIKDAQENGLKICVGERKMVFTVRQTNCEPGLILLNMLHRKFLSVTLDQVLNIIPFQRPEDKYILTALTLSIGELRKARGTTPPTVDCTDLSEAVIKIFNHQVLQSGQALAFKTPEGVLVELEVAALFHSHKNQSEASNANFVTSIGEMPQGLLLSSTEIAFKKKANATIKLSGNKVQRSVNKMMDVNFEKLGIGGLDKEFTTIFRRAFASRTCSQKTMSKMGIQHVRGLMLYGPPGCGKTLIARQISKVLQGGGEDAREPKVVNGPEILSKFVGEAEKNVRELFADAEQEQEENGDESELHVIIFDEIDAICKQRGSTNNGTGVNDSLVNQLLSKIDGVNALNNILVIGMTNRLDMIDSALLRPGRFEVQIEIGLPDEHGRTQILHIHTGKMKAHGILGNDISIPYLAKETKNFSGAEIEGLVKSAGSHALHRHMDIGNLAKPLNEDEIRVEAADFELALREVVPAFGVKEDELSLCYRNGVINYGNNFKQVTDTFMQLANQVKVSEKTPLLSLLLSGSNGSGKTALVAKIAADSGFPFVKMITPDAFIGMHENTKCSKIATVFEDAYKSPLSIIILDDIERLIDYVDIGPRFSNLVLQTLLVLINKAPPKSGRRLMIVGTTSVPHLMDQVGISKVFNVQLTVPELESESEIVEVLQHVLQPESNENQEVSTPVEVIQRIANDCVKPMGIKKLLMIVEMARQNEPTLTYNRFMECLMSTTSV